MFKYNPSDAMQCLPEGDYPATIKSAEETTSKAGNPMLAIKYTVHSPRGDRELTDWIVSDMAWKLKKIAKSINQEASFLKGEFFANDYIGHHLTLTLNVEEHEKYGEQNRIQNYKPYIGARPFSPPAQTPENVPDEQIPF